jgi:hypothetical protein
VLVFDCGERVMNDTVQVPPPEKNMGSFSGTTICFGQVRSESARKGIHWEWVMKHAGSGEVGRSCVLITTKINRKEEKLSSALGLMSQI